MTHPPIAIALALSLLAGIATAAALMPPRDDVFPATTASVVLPAGPVRRARESCDGYLTLHILLRSAREADGFRERGRCMQTLLDGTKLRRSNSREFAALTR